jgi:fibro-slime domain-containing protein
MARGLGAMGLATGVLLAACTQLLGLEGDYHRVEDVAGTSAVSGGTAGVTEGSDTAGRGGSGAAGTGGRVGGRAGSHGGGQLGAGSGGGAGREESSGAPSGAEAGSGGDLTGNAGNPGGCVSSCGNGVIECEEECDDGNHVALDGCSPQCRKEPYVCGDGIVLGEACDDGNRTDGDGCSSSCTIEKGFECTSAVCDQPGGGCVLRLPVTFRDFNGSMAPGGHPDFQPGYNSSGAIQGLVSSALDMEGKPVLSPSASVDNGFMHGQSAFAQWYRDDPGVNANIPGEIVLWDDGQGGYVNRWGQNGEQWPGDTNAPPGPQPPAAAYDGNPLFFPLDSAPGILDEPRSEGKVPEQYGWQAWPRETEVASLLGITTPIPTATADFPSTMHNFSFTTELKFWFRYESGMSAQLNFSGDDDVWIFLNGHLAVDLGGWHVPLNGSIVIDQQTISVSAQLTYSQTGTNEMTAMSGGTADDYGMVGGSVYPIQIFQAEREVEGSSFRLGLTGIDARRSVCAPQ